MWLFRGERRLQVIGQDGTPDGPRTRRSAATVKNGCPPGPWCARFTPMAGLKNSVQYTGWSWDRTPITYGYV